MSARQSSGGFLLVAACLAIFFTPWLASAQGGETVGVVTEIKLGRGRVEVKPSGSIEWRPVTPLLALRPGDAIQATENASVVILLSGGRGSVRVDASRSPFVVPAPQPGETKMRKAVALLESSLGFLSSGTKELPQAVLATRAAVKPPVVMSPRNGPVLPDSLTFEWQGSRFSRYTVRVVGPGGVVLERAGLTGGKFDYPADAPPLRPGARYTFQVLASGHPTQEAWFEVLEPVRAQAIRQDLAELDQAMGPALSPSSLATLKVGYLAGKGLIHDARLTLVAALRRDPDEPTLHFLLGNLYARSGLPSLAAEEYDEAQFLSTGGAAQPPPVKR